MKLLFFWTVLTLITSSGSVHGWPHPTKGGDGVDLSKKMFTLSRYNGGLVIYSPYYSSPTSHPTRGYTSDYYSTSTPSYTQTNSGPTETAATATNSYPTSTTTFGYQTHTYPQWSTPPSTRSVSVCLRYITDTYYEGNIATLSPNSNSLTLKFNGPLRYALTFNGYDTLTLSPSIKLQSGLSPNIWISICITVDGARGVAQMFKDSSMSIRKMLSYQWSWSGEPKIDFSTFEGQVSDVQVWDYPLRYKEVFYYMSSGYYGPYKGNVLTWSHISYSATGRTLLEENYELQIRKHDRGRGRNLRKDDPLRGLRSSGAKKTREGITHLRKA